MYLLTIVRLGDPKRVYLVV